MTARRSTSDPVSEFLDPDERVVWRYQPASRALFRARLPPLLLMLAITAFVGWVATRIIRQSLPAEMPTEFSLWFIVPAAFIGMALFVLFLIARLAWESLQKLIDSWSTHYALTDRRFMVVCNRGLIAFDASFFQQMEILSGAEGEQMLLFDYGPSGRRRLNTYRERIAGLSDAAALEQLIRKTLRP
ncbi:MAG: hypothetical protein R3C16_10135 [Hyphomonadaceae bacterium]